MHVSRGLRDVSCGPAKSHLLCTKHLDWPGSRIQLAQVSQYLCGWRTCRAASRLQAYLRQLSVWICLKYYIYQSCSMPPPTCWLETWQLYRHALLPMLAEACFAQQHLPAVPSLLLV